MTRARTRVRDAYICIYASYGIYIYIHTRVCTRLVVNPSESAEGAAAYLPHAVYVSLSLRFLSPTARADDG